MCLYTEKRFCQKCMKKSLSLDSQIMKTPINLVANVLRVLSKLKQKYW